LEGEFGVGWVDIEVPIPELRDEVRLAGQRSVRDNQGSRCHRRLVRRTRFSPRVLPVTKFHAELIRLGQIAEERMQYTVTIVTPNIKKWAIVLTVIGIAGTAIVSAGRADESDAKRLLKAMSDYLGSQKAISFDYDVSLELVSTQQQKIALASSGTLTLNRPDKLHLTRTGGFANVEMVFDGKTLTLLGKNTNLYTQVGAPGTARSIN